MRTQARPNTTFIGLGTTISAQGKRTTRAPGTIDNRPTDKGLETPQTFPGIDVTTELERVTVVR